jgi:hypothetical protein
MQVPGTVIQQLLRIGTVTAMSIAPWDRESHTGLVSVHKWPLSGPEVSTWPKVTCPSASYWLMKMPWAENSTQRATSMSNVIWDWGINCIVDRVPGSQRSFTRKGSGQEWTRQDIRKDSLTQEGNDKTHIERARRLMTNWQNFIFLSQLYTKEEET